MHTVRDIFHTSTFNQNDLSLRPHRDALTQACWIQLRLQGCNLEQSPSPEHVVLASYVSPCSQCTLMSETRDLLVLGPAARVGPLFISGSHRAQDVPSVPRFSWVLVVGLGDRANLSSARKAIASFCVAEVAAGRLLLDWRPVDEFESRWPAPPSSGALP